MAARQRNDLGSHVSRSTTTPFGVLALILILATTSSVPQTARAADPEPSSAQYPSAEPTGPPPAQGPTGEDAPSLDGGPSSPSRSSGPVANVPSDLAENTASTDTVWDNFNRTLPGPNGDIVPPRGDEVLGNVYDVLE